MPTTVTEGNAALVNKLGANTFLAGMSQLNVVSIIPTNGDAVISTSLDIFVPGVGGVATYSKTPFTVSGGNCTITKTITPPVNYTTFQVIGTYRAKDGYCSDNSPTCTSLVYSAPQITSFSVRRANSAGGADDKGEYAIMSVTASINSLSNKNTAKYTLSYRVVGTSIWSPSTPISLATSGYTYSATNQLVKDGATTVYFPASSSYEFKFEATDILNAPSSMAAISTTFAVIDTTTDGTGIAIGKFAEANNLLDINLPARFRQTVTFDNPAAALRAVGVIYSTTLPATGVEGQVCLVPI